ncbi:MAG: LCP family protein, partial [Firmicutes bacterium]|nr:LCP family protein [Bacillota bacterium]
MKHYDIIVVGAGAAGVFMAYELTKLGCGADVLVIEKGAPLAERACPIAKGLTEKCIRCNPCHIMNGYGGAGSVDYYFAVTMPVVKEIVDALGGVEYDLDVDFTMDGRGYKKGVQFMDGQAVLDYFRVRKNVEQPGDQNRINRQKKMLIALFDACRERNLIVKFPQIVKAFAGKLFTNMNADQVVALALFAYHLKSENIVMHSMGGTTTDIYNWTFVLTDQEERVRLIKEIYGINVPEKTLYSRSYCLWEWANLQ